MATETQDPPGAGGTQPPPVVQLAPAERPDSSWDEEQGDLKEHLEASEEDRRKLRAQLDKVYEARRRIGYGLIIGAYVTAAALVIATIAQMPTLKEAWLEGGERVDNQALLLLAIAHVGVTVAAIFLLSRLVSVGERLALPRAMVRHAERLLGRGQPGASTMRRTLREFADLIGRARGGGAP